MRDSVTSDERRRYYLRAGLWDDSTLAGRVESFARTRPDDTAVVDAAGHRRHTYRQLQQDATTVAAVLADLGVRSGDVVSVQLPNWYETVAIAVAIQRIGAVINPLLPNYRSKELTHVFATAAPSVIFTPVTYRGFDYGGLIGEVCDASGQSTVHIVVGAGQSDGSQSPRLEDILAHPRNPASVESTPASHVSELIFTSGTEASPKAIMHTEQTTNFSVRVAHQYLEMDAEDVVWMPSPIGHSTGFNYGVRMALYHGLKLVLQDQWDPAVAIELIEGEGCTYTLVATTFLQDLVEQARRDGKRLPQLQRLGCGGAPVPPPLVDRAEEVGIGVLRLYGSTEALVATWNGPHATTDQRRQTDGRPLPDIDVEIRDAGEIYVRGPDTCVGFFNDPERTAGTFVGDGWVRTGDLATLDPDGYLTVVGRKKEIIIRGGINIAPREIEELLLRFPEIERAAVVGLPDERLGERSCACVCLVPGASLELATMVDRLRDSGLATYKLPERLVILDNLPTTASGKVQKHEIVRQLLDEPRTITGKVPS